MVLGELETWDKQVERTLSGGTQKLQNREGERERGREGEMERGREGEMERGREGEMEGERERGGRKKRS